MAKVVDVRSVVVQGLLVLLPCALITLVAGGFFVGMEKYFTTLLPGLIIVVPPLLGLRGNINGALASRLGTGLNSGLIRPRLELSAEIKINLASSLILSVIASAAIGIFAFGVNLLTGALAIGALELLVKLMVIAILAGFISGLILAFLTVLVAITSYARGWDPDNVTSPAMAAVGDFVTIVCIYLAVLLVV